MDLFWLLFLSFRCLCVCARARKLNAMVLSTVGISRLRYPWLAFVHQLGGGGGGVEQGIFAFVATTSNY